MPFGKFRGMDLADIPQQYLEWLVKKMQAESPANDPLLVAMRNEAAFRRQCARATHV